ncbi:condensation domain-containing protein, partial [Micromonospora sp. NPDC002296]|uniref:condensation domain-containing protein n=1 Tax=Micromonospora sp. NPDC002296 TaxID=3154271 RepID=UPI00332D2869
MNTVAPSVIEDVMPLSPLQEGMLFHAQYDREEKELYIAQFVVDFTGRLDTAALQDAARHMLTRHANLRAVFRYRNSGEPIQVVRRNAPFEWVEEMVDPAVGSSEAAARADLLVEEDWQRGVDIGSPVLIRFLLIGVGPEQWRLVITHHHLLLDGWSMAVFLRELFDAYARGAAALEPVVPYRDYIRWLANWDKSAAQRLWRQVLDGFTTPSLVAETEVSTSTRTRLSVPEDVSCVLDESLSTAIMASARACGVTANTAFQAAWAIVISQILGRDDVAFGSTVSGRPTELPEADRMIGLFINTVPVRVTVDPDATLRELLGEVQGQRLDLAEHDHLGLVEMQRIAGLGGQLFDTNIVFDNFPANDFLVNPGTSSLLIRDVRFKDTSHYPISLVVEPRRQIELRLHYRPDLFDEPAMSRLLARLVRVLGALAADPGVRVGSVDLLGEGERHRLLVSWNETAREFPALAVHE